MTVVPYMGVGRPGGGCAGGSGKELTTTWYWQTGKTLKEI